MHINVVDLMVSTAVAEETATIAEARRALLRYDAAEVYIVDAESRLRGVVTDYDFLKAELAGLPETAPVAMLVSTRVETVDASADLSRVLSKFREAWCGRIAVLRQGRLVGQLRRGDVLKLIVQLREVAAVTEATADRHVILAGPHFGRRAKLRPQPRKLGQTPKMRRLAAGA